MNCISCSKDNVIVFFNEIIPCAYCNEDNNISYNICQDCGLVWKAINGNVLSEVVFEETELSGMLDGAFEKFMGFVSEVVPTPTMNEVVHKCLRCETVAFETAPKLYHCPECGFEWEVL